MGRKRDALQLPTLTHWRVSGRRQAGGRSRPDGAPKVRAVPLGLDESRAARRISSMPGT